MAVDSAGFRQFAKQMGLPRSATEELISQVEGIDEKIAALESEVARLRNALERELKEMRRLYTPHFPPQEYCPCLDCRAIRRIEEVLRDG